MTELSNQSALAIQKGQGFAISNVDELKRVGSMMVMSQFFAGQGDANTLIAQACVKILAGSELGLTPYVSMSGIHIIQGKPSLSAGLMASIIKRSPKYRYTIVKHDKTTCEIECFERDEETREWLSMGVSEFTWEDGITAGIANGKNKGTWQAYPKAMLFSRAISQAWRWYFGDLMLGCSPYTPEELGVPVNGEGEIVEVEVVRTQQPALPPLPFKDPSSAYQWASEKLDCSIEEARSLFEGVTPDAQGKKGRAFYHLIEDRCQALEKIDTVEAVLV